MSEKSDRGKFHERIDQQVPYPLLICRNGEHPEWLWIIENPTRDIHANWVNSAEWLWNYMFAYRECEEKGTLMIEQVRGKGVNVTRAAA